MRRILVILSYILAGILGWTGSNLLLSWKKQLIHEVKSEDVYNRARTLLLEDTNLGKDYLEQQSLNLPKEDRLETQYLIAWAAFSKGEYIESSRLVNSVLIEQDNEWLEANCFYLLGYLKKTHLQFQLSESTPSQQDLDNAMKDSFHSFFKAYDLYSKMNQPDNVYLALLGLASTKLAESSLIKKDAKLSLVAAEQYLDQASSLIKELNVSTSMGSYYLLRAQTYHLRQEFSKSLAEVELANSEFERHDEFQSTIACEITKSALLIRMNRVKEGYDIATRLEAKLKDSHNEHLIAQNLVNIYLAKKCLNEDYSSIYDKLNTRSLSDLTLFIQLSDAASWSCR